MGRALGSGLKIEFWTLSSRGSSFRGGQTWLAVTGHLYNNVLHIRYTSERAQSCQPVLQLTFSLQDIVCSTWQYGPANQSYTHLTRCGVPHVAVWSCQPVLHSPHQVWCAARGSMAQCEQMLIQCNACTTEMAKLM